MADDAAAPEGELTQTSGSSADSFSASTDGTTELPDALDVSDDEVAVAYPEEDGLDAVLTAPKRSSAVRLATAVGLVAVLALTGLVGWLGWRGYQAHAAAQQRAEFIQVGKQAAINLTTIDFETADADVKRILDSATDEFYDDFSKRSQPFVEVVKQAQAKSSGEVTEAGLESQDGDTAQVLVAVTVKATNAGVPEQNPRYWRMRVSVKQVDNEVKVSNVGFVA